MIYHALRLKRDELGSSVLDFHYERHPTEAVRVKTDFTVIYLGKIWYWEHLGRLGNRTYEGTWQTIKRPTYNSNGLESSLITTDELSDISTEKIDRLVQLIVDDAIESEDKSNKYSLHHYSLL